MKSCFLLFVLVFTTFSCYKAERKPGQLLRINIQDEPQSLDPRKARDLSAVTIMHMLFEGLARTGKSGCPELALAKEMQVTDDGLTYTFSLRNAEWSDGAPVTSYDFAYSWKKQLDPLFPSDLAYQLFVIRGARKAKTGEAGADQIAIRVPDSKTLVVDLEVPIPYFLELLTFPAFFPVPQHIEKKNANWMQDFSTYISNGPFKLQLWEHSNRMQVVRNPFYWDAENVHLQGIEMVMVNADTELRMFQDRQLDWAGSPLSTLPPDAVAQFKQTKDFQVKPVTGTYFLRVNTEANSPLSHPLLRRALALAIDRQSITEHILQGGHQPAMALVPPAMGLSQNGYFNDADRHKAADLLDLYCEREEISKKDLPPITLLYSAGERNHSIAMTLKQQIENSLGIRVELEAAERKLYFERLSKKQYQIATGSWFADFNDPINFLEVFKFKEGSSNNTGWENAKYVESLNQSLASSDLQERRKILREAEKILLDQMPIIPIFHFVLNYLQRPELEDISLSSIGQIDFRWCKISEAAR